MITVSDLIREHQDRTGDSYNDIARRGGLSKAKVGQFADPTNRYMVREETMKKLAKGLGVPLSTVKRAAVATSGYQGVPTITMSPRVRAIAERLQDMTPAQVALVGDIVETIARRAPRRKATTKEA